MDSLARQVRSNKARQGRQGSDADGQAVLEQAKRASGRGCENACSTTSPLGPAVVMGRRQTAGGAAAAQESESRQADNRRQGSLTRTRIHAHARSASRDKRRREKRWRRARADTRRLRLGRAALLVLVAMPGSSRGCSDGARVAMRSWGRATGKERE